MPEGTVGVETEREPNAGLHCPSDCIEAELASPLRREKTEPGAEEPKGPLGLGQPASNTRRHHWGPVHLQPRFFFG